MCCGQYLRPGLVRDCADCVMPGLTGRVINSQSRTRLSSPEPPITPHIRLNRSRAALSTAFFSPVYRQCYRQSLRITLTSSQTFILSIVPPTPAHSRCSSSRCATCPGRAGSGGVGRAALSSAPSWHSCRSPFAGPTTRRGNKWDPCPQVSCAEIPSEVPG